MQSATRLLSTLGLGSIALFGLTACGSGGGSGTGPNQPNTGDARLVAAEYGRLVDVFGLRRTPEGVTVDLFRQDVVVGPDIQDERGPSSTKRDDEIEFDFIASNPDNLQPRLLITREIGTDEFDKSFRKLGRKLRPVAAGLFGQDVNETPFTVVPRNAAIRLTFSQKLGVGDEFFVTRDAQGRVTGLKNTEAVQLLAIVGDPRDGNDTGDFQVIKTRLVVRDNLLIVDPVLLGSEGLQYQTRNNASGMPESPDQLGANIRLAIALEGPLRIPGVLAPAGSPFVGKNLAGERSIIRDFRSGNRADNTPDIARGFIRDAEPPRIVGELLFFLEQVDRLNDTNQVVTVYKNDRNHEIDRGDVLRFIDPATGLVLGTSEVVVDPVDDVGDPAVQHVRVVIRTVPGLAAIDPRANPNFPRERQRRESWLRRFGPRVVLVAEYTASRINPNDGEIYGDEPRNFLSFTPSPLPEADGTPSPPDQNISPFASAIIRFTKPVDMSTVRAFDSFFFATRDVLDIDVITERFIAPRQIDPEEFDFEKFKTPHLVVSQIVDEDGSQTSIRLQPTKGFYLDQQIRETDEPLDFPVKQFKYYLHLLGGQDGIRDLAGNSLDFQAQTGVQDFLVIPFSLDTRTRPSTGEPVFSDNIVVSIARRFASKDEDEQPSYYIDGEYSRLGEPVPPEAFALQDLFGSVAYLSDGKLQARPTSRVTKIVDDLNQQPPPSQDSDLRFCPASVGGEAQVATATATVRFGAGIQNPLNPFGARLQTVWREIDMSLSRVDPFDFNLDVEQMWWAPFQESPITYDEFDRVTLFLGHSEYRPEPCVGAFGALPTLPNSGLGRGFADNYVHNNAPVTGIKEEESEPHPAYQDRRLVIDAALAITEPNNVNRFMPLPEFDAPYFVWRDETRSAQGGNSGAGSDVRGNRQTIAPYLISPWLTGGGRLVTSDRGNLVFNRGFWGNFGEFRIENGQRDSFTGGALGTIALPLLADFWTYCDDPELPEGNGFIATGFNGWQIALAVQSSPQPNFRAYSGGFAGFGARPPICRSTSDPEWVSAAGGFTPTGAPTRSAVDNSVYWIMADYLKRQTVVTFGFVDILNPHRMPDRTPGTGDPRLGPFLVDQGGGSSLPQGVLPNYDWHFEPPLDDLPAGTSVVPEFRAASVVDPNPWRALALQWPQNRRPNEVNFPLDPLKACDAHIRKFDDRTVNGAARDYWAYYYTRQITDYTSDVEQLADDRFTSQFVGPREQFNAKDVKYFNWRFIMLNNVTATPPVSPSIESFAVTYRFERRR